MNTLAKPKLTVAERIRLACQQAGLDYDVVIRDWNAFAFAYHLEMARTARDRLVKAVQS